MRGLSAPRRYLAVTPNNQNAADAPLQDSLGLVRILTDQRLFTQARAECRRLVQERPQSAEAHAAMGDVCSAEGAWTEAVQWYEQALDLGFDPAVMEKLAAARGRATRGTTTPPTAVAPLAPELPPSERRLARQGLVGIVVAGVVLLSMLALLVMIMVGRESPDELREAERIAAPAQTELPAQPSGTPPPSGQPPSAGGPGSGAALPQAGPRQPPQAPVSYTGGQPVRSPQAPDQNPSYVPADTVASAQEKAILRQMYMERFREGTSVGQRSSLAFDQRSGFAILTLTAPQMRDLERLEVEILTTSFRAAVSAMRSDVSLQSIVVRVISRVPNDLGEPEDTVIFRGSTSRDALRYWLGASEQPSLAQLKTMIFPDAWWDQAALDRYVRAQPEGE